MRSFDHRGLESLRFVLGGIGLVQPGAQLPDSQRRIEAVVGCGVDQEWLRHVTEQRITSRIDPRGERTCEDLLVVRCQVCVDSMGPGVGVAGGHGHRDPWLEREDVGRHHSTPEQPVQAIRAGSTSGRDTGSPPHGWRPRP